ncbi:MAG: hypothetical protein COY53_08055 [Elusimicrobia bacterium CG_4_10_14_0_8_um_filter_37_32]|nr:MAG: hypothetical protein COY53_08055 [Elusimicrobia bacterium CG_4_10_14_0_8_um_filter_37_32]
MNEKVVSYEADLNQEYETLTEKHGTIKSQLEKTLSHYLKERKGKPVTIQGPYGSGKTQLLYHLFKFTWKNGGIGIYTHLEKIISEREIGPSKYADYLRELVNEEVDLLRKSESKLMAGKVKDYAISRIEQINGENSCIVLFIDEIEQRYKLLDETVKTDDHSPMREVIARVNKGESGFYLILAFAPVSFYEFSKGEAQTGRFLPIILPIVEPKTFRKKFKEIGNLIWWVGRGRYRGILRIQDILKTNVPDINKISKKELFDVCHSIGSIGGVPALDFESIDKIDAFEDFRSFLIPVEPKESGGEIHSGAIKIVEKCELYEDKKHNLNDVLEKSLRSSEVSEVTNISYYLSVILDGLSTSEGKVPLFTNADDWKELLNMVEDIMLEFGGENKLALEDLRKLRDNNISNFSYKIRRNAENIGVLQEGYCIAPKFLHTLFPFPISSPNLISDKKIEEQRENLGDQTYLGREEYKGISIFFFLNENKIRDFLVQESKNFLKETKGLVAVNLGKSKINNVPKLARWLQNQGRLKIITPSGALMDFLVSFFYWVRDEKRENLPINSLSEKLTENQSIPEKDKVRKIAYYNSRVKEYFDSELPKLPSSKYILSNKTGFDDFKTGRVGFVPEITGFSFVDGKNDWEVIYRFRDEFEKTQFIRKESTNEKTGVPSAVEKLVVVDKKIKGITTGAVLKRISHSFSKYLPDLNEVVGEISKDEFITIPADDDSEQIFEGIFLYLKEWKDPSKAGEKFREVKSHWDELRSRIDELSKKMREFEKLTDENSLLTHRLEADKAIIVNIGKILSNYQTKISPYTKFLLSTFIEKTVEVVEPKLNEIEKRFSEFQNSVKDKIEEYKSAFENVEAFEKDTFVWINKSKDEISKEFQQEFKDVCQDFTKEGKIDLENVPDAELFIVSVEEIADKLCILGGINECIKQCKTKALEINKKLGEWEAK